MDAVIDLALDLLLGAVLVLACAALAKYTFSRCGRCGSRLIFTFEFMEFVPKEVIGMLKLTNEERVLLTVMALTAHGRPAAIDGSPSFESSDPSIVEIQPGPAAGSALSANSVYAVAKGIGSARITATADADVGAGVENITGFLDIEVLPAKAVTLGIVTGTPEAQPIEAPATTTAPAVTTAPPAEPAPAGDAAEPAPV